VISAGPHANHLLQTDNHTSTLSLNFYRLDALPDTQPMVSKHIGVKALKAIKALKATSLHNNSQIKVLNMCISGQMELP